MLFYIVSLLLLYNSCRFLRSRVVGVTAVSRKVIQFRGVRCFRVRLMHDRLETKLYLAEIWSKSDENNF